MLISNEEININFKTTLKKDTCFKNEGVRLTNYVRNKTELSLFYKFSIYLKNYNQAFILGNFLNKKRMRHIIEDSFEKIKLYSRFGRIATWNVDEQNENR